MGPLQRAQKGGPDLLRLRLTVAICHVPFWAEPLRNSRKLEAGKVYKYHAWLCTLRDGADANLWAVVWEVSRPGPIFEKGWTRQSFVVVDPTFEHFPCAEWSNVEKLPVYSMTTSIEGKKVEALPHLGMGDVIRVHRARISSKPPRYINIRQQGQSATVAFPCPNELLESESLDNGVEVAFRGLQGENNTIVPADKARARKLQMWIQQRLSKESMSQYLTTIRELVNLSAQRDLVVQVQKVEVSPLRLVVTDGSGNLRSLLRRLRHNGWVLVFGGLAFPGVNAGDPAGPVLDPLTLGGIADFIKSGRCKSIFFLTGAGVSTGAGIPDFRSPGGMYDSLRPELLTATEPQRRLMRQDPVHVVTKEMFFQNQFPYMEVRRPFILGVQSQKWKATLSHWFMKFLDEEGLLKRVFTQNIDGLDYQTGIRRELVTNVHGSIANVSCEGCGRRMSFDAFCDKVRSQIKDIYKVDPTAPETSTEIHCPSCNQPLVKPSTVLFGSSLPREFFKQLPELTEADLLIVAGTSLQVSPANSVVSEVSDKCVRLIVNKEPVGEMLGVRYGEAAVQDVWTGEMTCDEAFMELIKMLGWQEKLRGIQHLLPESNQELIKGFVKVGHWLRLQQVRSTGLGSAEALTVSAANITQVPSWCFDVQVRRQQVEEMQIVQVEPMQRPESSALPSAPSPAAAHRALARAAKAEWLMFLEFPGAIEDVAPPLSAMLEVLSVTGESIAVFEDEEIADPPASISQPDSAAVDPRAGKGKGKFFTPAEVGKGKGKFFPRVPAPDAALYHGGGKGKGKFFTPRVPAPDADIYHRGGKGKGKFFAPRVPAPDADIYHRGGKGKGEFFTPAEVGKGKGKCFTPRIPAPDAAGNASVKALKQRLARKIGLPRFRLRLLQDNCPLDDNQTLIVDQQFSLQVVQLVILEFLPPDKKQNRRIILACEENDDAILSSS
eukprot:symbB.v1.2.037374.t1/scaffold5502.1/size38168/2